MATLYVGLNEKIQEKILQASDGDVIMVSAGTYNENLDVYKGVKIYGAGKTNTIIQGSHKATVVKSATWPLGTTTINLADTSGLEVGRIISGTGIPANTRIAGINPNVSITLTAATTSARTVATNISMVQQADGTVRVRGGTSTVFAELKDLKIVGYNGPTPEAPAIEYAAVYFRNTGAGSTAAQYAVLNNCHIESNGEAAIISDAAAGVGNLTVTNCLITGKTFLGDIPSSGNQYSIPNVPRHLVVFQANNLPITFTNNTIEGVTGGLDASGVPSFNSAVTIDAPGSVITGNTINTTSGTGYGLRARGLNSVVQDNSNLGTSAGYYILPNHSNGVVVSVGTMIFNSSKYWICTQSHTSSATNAPTGAEGSLYWSEITLQQVNESGSFGVGLQIIGSNDASLELLVSVVQEEGMPLKVTMSKAIVKSIPKVANSGVFSNEANWKLVSYIFKKTTNAQRLVSAFRDFDAEKSVKLKSGMLEGDEFELHKIIISTSDRTLMVVKRSEIEDAESFDFVLQ